MFHARAVLIALLAWWTLRLCTAAMPSCFLDLVNLAFHEAGHLFLIPFGDTMHFLGGTLGQLAVPAGLAGYFLVARRQPFAAAVCAWWTGENLVNISVYMADARDLTLPLVGGGDHDWNNLFYTFGLLGEDSVRRVSTLTHHLGVVVMLAGLAWAGSFLLRGSARERFDAFVEERTPALAPFFATE
ncbi:MAG TPA: hypothetical protein VMQ62_08830 [Dongiaceae bacterium]|nr:hypothetical protein [Dongiaceae bacterium]